jgi:transcriptional regulator with XRE-family HTH domain
MTPAEIDRLITDLIAANAFGQAVRRTRQGQRRTQGQVATHAGLTLETVSHVERGEVMPGLATVIRLALALGVTLDALVPLDGIS